MDALQIIAEPRRREILSLIWDDELAAQEIAGHFDITFGAISQHLAKLLEAGLVSVRTEGNHRFYTADRQVLAPYAPILESMWGRTLDRLSEVIEREESN